MRCGPSIYHRFVKAFLAAWHNMVILQHVTYLPVTPKLRTKYEICWKLGLCRLHALTIILIFFFKSKYLIPTAELHWRCQAVSNKIDISGTTQSNDFLFNLIYTHTDTKQKKGTDVWFRLILKLKYLVNRTALFIK